MSDITYTICVRACGLRACARARARVCGAANVGEAGGGGPEARASIKWVGGWVSGWVCGWVCGWVVGWEGGWEGGWVGGLVAQQQWEKSADPEA